MTSSFYKYILTTMVRHTHSPYANTVNTLTLC